MNILTGDKKCVFLSRERKVTFNAVKNEVWAFLGHLYPIYIYFFILDEWINTPKVYCQNSTKYKRLQFISKWKIFV